MRLTASESVSIGGDQMTEEWKAYDATYEVSNYGRVRNSKMVE